MPSNADIVQGVRDLIRDPDEDKDANPITPRYQDPVILRKLNLIASEVARRTLCVKKTVTIATVLAQQEYTLPSDYIQIRSITHRSSPGATPILLQEVPLSETIAVTLTRLVDGYARRTDTVIRLTGEPSAAAADGLVVDYFGLPAALTAVTDPALEIPERYHDAVIYGTASKMNLVDEEPSKAGDNNALFEAAIQSALDREAQATHSVPRKVRDAYNPITGTYGVI